jgi:perosamine synthetase
MNDDLPALLGGPPLRPQGPPEWPPRDEAIRSALEALWQDGGWGRYESGHVESLESRLADYHGVPHALTCGSGTFAVELALRALKVGPGDEVLLCAYDYPGNFLTIHALGALPVLVDLDPHTGSLCPDHLESSIGPMCKAMIVSHLHGGLAPMARLREIADRRNLPIVEDACQCPGAVIDGRRAGTWGDVGVLSFGGSKLLTAGRGGAILTSRADVHQRARLSQLRGSSLQAAVLSPQLEKLDDRNRHRRERVAHLRTLLSDVPGLRFLESDPHNEPSHYKVGMLFDASRFGLDRATLVKAVRAEGIALDEGFRASHLGRASSRFRVVGTLPGAETAHHQMVILHHPVLLGTVEEMQQVATAFSRARRASKELK